MVDKALMREIGYIISSGQTSPFFKNFAGGPWVQRFEKDFSRYVGSRHAVSVANGTLALNAAYSVLHCETGMIAPKAITTPWTFIATGTELLKSGYEPVFCDVSLSTQAMLPISVVERISRETGLVVVMHPLGVPADIVELQGKLNNVPYEGPGKRVIVEDACQALGSSIEDKMCGTFGDIGCFSTQMTKSVSTGEGGMCVTDNEEYYRRLMHIRNHGNKYGDKEGYSHIVCSNYRMTEIQACIGVHALKEYPAILKAQAKRREILLEGMVMSPLLAQLRPPGICEVNGYIIGARVKTESDRNELRGEVLRKLRRFNRKKPGYTIGPGYSELLYELPVLASFRSACPNAEILKATAVWFDIRKMSIETVKDLARAVGKLKS